MIVVDANVLIGVLVPSASTPAVRRVFARDAEWAAPILAASEVRNVLLGCMRRREMSLDEAVAAMDGVALAIGDREFGVESKVVLSLAVTSGCSACDCEYVAVADRLGVELVTFDKQVLKAFPRLAVTPEAFAAG